MHYEWVIQMKLIGKYENENNNSTPADFKDSTFIASVRWRECDKPDDEDPWPEHN